VIRRNHFSLFVAAVLVVLGFIMNRLNVSITGMESVLGHYFPSWTEISVTSMIVALGFALFATAVKYLPVFPAEDAQPTTAPDLLAPNVLGQPLFSSTTLVLVLSGLFFGTSLLLGGNGLWLRMQTKGIAVSVALASPINIGDRYFTMPADISFPKAESSPGQVIFRHSSHVDAKEAQCLVCHQERFRLLQASAPASSGGRDFHSSQFCGACHNGEKSFNVKEDCQSCHEAK
jgi:c(7)-type cytochrome triheme protein